MFVNLQPNAPLTSMRFIFSFVITHLRLNLTPIISDGFVAIVCLIASGGSIYQDFVQIFQTLTCDSISGLLFRKIHSTYFSKVSLTFESAVHKCHLDDEFVHWRKFGMKCYARLIESRIVRE